jgi:hypothetical protein
MWRLRVGCYNVDACLYLSLMGGENSGRLQNWLWYWSFAKEGKGKQAQHSTRPKDGVRCRRFRMLRRHAVK